jgi:spermidine synthase
MPSIEVSEKQGVRYLHFGSPLVQGAMRIARPTALELEYTREMLFPLLLRSDAAWPSSVLQIGLGSASLTKFLHRHRPAARITAVEIRPDVVAAARQFFKLPETSARFGIAIADAHDFLAQARRKFDLVLVDGFDAWGNAGMLDTVPFHLNVRARLRPGGVATYNLLSGREGAGPLEERLRRAFGEALLVLPPCGAGNRVAIGTNGNSLRGLLQRRAALETAAIGLKAQTGLDLRPTLARLVTA